jgi:hypothetical protein
VADVSIHDGFLHIAPTVPERVLSLHAGDVQIPLDRIGAVTTVKNVMTQLRGMKMPGAGFPGILAIGTWRGDANGATYHDFVVVHRPGPGLVITIDGGPYDRVLLGTEQPQELVDALAG